MVSESSSSRRRRSVSINTINWFETSFPSCWYLILHFRPAHHVIMIPRTWQRFRAAGSSSSSSSRNVMFSEEARRAMAADRVRSVPLVDVVGGVSDSFSTYSWFDFQQIAKMVDQILPFSLLLLIVLIRRHMECMIFFCFSSYFSPSNVPVYWIGLWCFWCVM